MMRCVRQHPIWVGSDLAEFYGRGVAGRPQFHRLIVNRESTAQNFSPRISGIPVHTDFAERQHAARLVVAKQNMRSIPMLAELGLREN
jgi:hypothetical protein